jgi:rhomboid protease GluP
LLEDLLSLKKRAFEIWVWLILLGILNAVVFYYYKPYRTLDFCNIGALSPQLTLNGEPFRLFSSLLLHGDILHLLINVLALIVLGPSVELLYGRFQLSFF